MKIAMRRKTRYWKDTGVSGIGNPGKDDLRAISPVSFAEKITAPVLIIQGKKDRRVPQDQAELDDCRVRKSRTINR